MRKIKLELDALAVESFATTPRPAARGGTVHGNDTLNTWCGQETCDGFCASYDTFCAGDTDYGSDCGAGGTTGISAGDYCGTDPNYCGTQGGGLTCYNQCVLSQAPGGCGSEITRCINC